MGEILVRFPMVLWGHTGNTTSLGAGRGRLVELAKTARHRVINTDHSFPVPVQRRSGRSSKHRDSPRSVGCCTCRLARSERGTQRRRPRRKLRVHRPRLRPPDRDGQRRVGRSEASSSFLVQEYRLSAQSQYERCYLNLPISGRFPRFASQTVGRSQIGRRVLVVPTITAAPRRGYGRRTRTTPSVRPAVRARGSRVGSSRSS